MNYFFQWSAVAASGLLEGRYERVIHGKNLSDACDVFEKQHGRLNPDENGVCLVIDHISFQPES